MLNKPLFNAVRALYDKLVNTRRSLKASFWDYKTIYLKMVDAFKRYDDTVNIVFIITVVATTAENLITVI